jgi:hypothetical protein
MKIIGTEFAEGALVRQRFKLQQRLFPLTVRRRNLRRHGAAAYDATGRREPGWICKPCCHSAVRMATRLERQHGRVRHCRAGWRFSYAGLDMGQKETVHGHLQSHRDKMPTCLICINMLAAQPAIMVVNSLPFQWSA